MPDIRVQDEQGNVHVFPDGSTPEMIAKVMGVKPPAAQPSLADTIKQGATVQQAMDPYVGFAKGVGQTAATAASLINKIPGIGETLAPKQGVQAMQKAVEPTNTMQAIGKGAEAVGEMAVPIGGGGAKVGSKVADVLPSAERAGKSFQEVMGAAKDIPARIQNASDIALDIQAKASRGGMMPKVVRDFLRRTTDPNLGALTYQEMQDFASNASRLSADEMGRLTPALRFQVGKFTQALRQSAQSAADLVGKGGQYSQAVGEYASAKRLEGLKDAVMSGAVKAGLGALGAAGASAIAKEVWDYLTPRR